MKNKNKIKTIISTSIIVFILTTAFYVSPNGALIYSIISDKANENDFSRFTKIERIIEDSYMGSYNKSALSDNAFHAYVASLNDPYSNFFNKREFESFNSNLDGQYRGIGITVGVKEDKIIIGKVNENSPASKAGLLKGDFITKVNNVSYKGEELSEAISAIKEVKNGESIVLTILRGSEVLDINVVVEKIEADYVNGKMLDDKTGYIKIDTFGLNIDKDFSKEIETLKSKGMKGLILDLRSNPGGALDSAVAVSDMLIGEGEIVTIKDKSGKEDVYTSDKNELGMSICVLINEESASASEVVSAALRDHKKAVLIGQKTYGKGVVQSVYDLKDGTGLRLTTAKYFTPSGECIDGIGIMPDIEVKLPEGIKYSDDELSIENDTQLQVAISEIKKMIK